VTGRDRGALALAVAAVAAITLGPVVLLVRRSLTDASGRLSSASFRALTHRTVGVGLLEPPIASLWVSVRTAALVAALATVIAVAVATAAARRHRAGPALRFAMTLPLAVSPVMLGLGILVAFAHRPIAWRTSWFMVPLVQTLVCLPFVLTFLRPSFDALSPRLRDSAATLGASPWRAWRTIELSALRRPVAASAALGFAVAVGEFGAASLLVRPARETLPVALTRLSSRPGASLAGQAAALAVVLGAVTVVATVLASALASRRRGEPSDRRQSWAAP
jgi:thiamine transport system permease protein